MFVSIVNNSFYKSLLADINQFEKMFTRSHYFMRGPYWVKGRNVRRIFPIQNTISAPVIRLMGKNI